MPKFAVTAPAQMSLWLEAAAPSLAPAARSEKLPEATRIPSLPPLTEQQKSDQALPLQAQALRLLSAVRALDAAAAKAAGGPKTLFRLFSTPGAGVDHPRADGPLGMIQMALTQALAQTPQTPASDVFLKNLIGAAGSHSRQRSGGKPGQNHLAPWLNQLAHMAAIHGNSTLWGAAFDAAGERATLLSPLLPICLPLGGEAFIQRAVQNSLLSADAPAGRSIAQAAFIALTETKEPEINAYSPTGGGAGSNRVHSAIDDRFDADGFSRLDALRALLSCERMPQSILDLALANCASENRINSAVFLLENGADFSARPFSKPPASAASALELSGIRDASENGGGFARLAEVALSLTQPQERKARNTLHIPAAKRGSADWMGDAEVSWIAAILVHANNHNYEAELPKERIRQLMGRGVFPLDEMEARYCLELAASLGDASFIKELAGAFKKAGVEPVMANSPILTNLKDARLVGSQRNNGPARDGILAELALALGDLGAPSRMKPETARGIGPRFLAANEAIRLRQSLKKGAAPAQLDALGSAPAAPAPQQASAPKPRRL